MQFRGSGRPEAERGQSQSAPKPASPELRHYSHQALELTGCCQHQPSPSNSPYVARPADIPPAFSHCVRNVRGCRCHRLAKRCEGRLAE